jgi:hypothetical protein
MSPELKNILSQAQKLDHQSQIQLISRLSTQIQPRTAPEDKMLQVQEQSINGYVLLEPASAIDFIQEHQELVALLNESYKEIRKYFPSEELKLELVSDREIAEDQQLFVYICTSLSVTDSLKKLDEFDEKWWLERIDRANGLLNFNLRFV